MRIIDGKEIASKKLEKLKDEIKLLSKSPKLAIILASDNQSSKIYVQNKIKAAKKIGIETELFEFDNNISNNYLINIIDQLNKRDDINGIIVQLPLPTHIIVKDVLLAVDYKKDVDGFNPYNTGLLFSGRDPLFTPCTPLGVLELIRTEFDDIAGKHAVVVGRSNIVGRPLASLLLKNDCTVSICHSKTQNLSSITSMGDIVVCAAGSKKKFGKEYFNEKSVVIDVGISRNELGKITGDVDFNTVYSNVRAITKVPGGVGPMTVASLMANTLRAYKLQKS